MSSVFPTQLDSNLELPPADKNVTEIDGSIINSLRDAIFNIQRTVGIEAQGNKASLAERVDVSLDDDGNIRSSAISGLGLVALPIDNSDVGTDAGIQESKLDLDFSTQSLKNSINSLQVNVNSLTSSLDSLLSNFNSHIFGIGNYHDGYDIQIGDGGTVGLDATTIGDAVNELATILFVGEGSKIAHIDLSLPDDISHSASVISVDASVFENIDTTSENVQEALESIDQEVLGQQIVHMDNFHSNGILKEINSGDNFNSTQIKITDGTATLTANSSIVQIAGVTSFADLGVNAGDILEVETGATDAGNYKINAVGPRSASQALGNLSALTANQLEVFYVFTTTESATVNVYDPASISSESAPLACAVRHSETLVDTISILNPNAARVVSLGFNGSTLNGALLDADGYAINVEVGLGNGQVRGLTIPHVNLELLGANQADPVDAQSVAERINAFVSDPTLAHHFPITAFKIGNELAIAHNLVGANYTLRVLDGYSANLALGFDAYGADILDDTIRGNSSNLFNVNGVSLSTINTIATGTATIASTTETFSIYDSASVLINPLALGIRAGAVVHITGHPTLDVNGSYTIEDVSATTISVFSAEQIPLVGVSTTFNILITDSHVSLNQLLEVTESNLGLVDLFIDQNGKALVQQKLTYEDDLPNINIVNVSNTFPTGTITLNQTDSGGLISFTITDDSNTGTSVTFDDSFVGTVRVYHPNNIDYLTINVLDVLSGNRTTQVEVFDSINSDEALKLSTVHFDGVDTINSVVDARQFGNVGASQISDSFIELFSQRPIDELRSNGVVRGFDVLDMALVDSLTNMQSLSLSGGIAYINGVRIEIETQRVRIPSYDSNNVLLPSGQKIIGVNEFGTLMVFSDQLGEILTDGYVSSIQFGRILPLYAVTLDSDGLISDYIDIRFFINNLDHKVELIVDETNNVVGNFRNLEGALFYANRFPSREKLLVKIINEVHPDAAISVPEGVSLIGNSVYGSKSRIINSSNLGTDFITLAGFNRIKDIEIDSQTVNLNGSLILVNGPNVVIEGCSLKFSETVGSFTNSEDIGIEVGAAATGDVKLIGNKIDNVYLGIDAIHGCENLLISGNLITDVVGTASTTYGIRVGNDTNVITNVSIQNNRIEVPTVATSDIIGILFDVSQNIDLVKIQNNSIYHANNDTMTSGVRVESTVGGAVSIANLIVSHNLINGIGLDDNSIFGCYIDDCENALIDGNIIRNIGIAGNTNTDDAFIKIAGGVTFAKICDNILEDGNVLSGIDVSSAVQVSIVGNTITNVGTKGTGVGTIGTSTAFIRGNCVGSMVSNNTLVGPGIYGIYWGMAGVRTQITNNTLTATSGDSFEEHAIRVLGTDMDISGNTITHMTNALNTTGISVGSGGNRNKITNNTIEGSEMDALISIYGAHNIVSGNLLKNTTNNTTIFIELNSVSISNISDNMIRGAGDNAITDSSTTVTTTIIANNNIGATISDKAISLGTSTSNCLVMGNILPASDTSTIGPTPATATINGNLIGANRNLLDTMGVSVAEGVSDGYWILDTAENAWQAAAQITSGESSSDRYLYFPLNKIPNGARLISIVVTGNRNASLADTLTVDLFRKSVQDTAGSLPSDSLTSTGSPITISSTGYFASTITFATASALNTVNYTESNYFVLIHSSGGTNLSSIHGLKLNFRY